jgi:bifunctional UDP-N-acetylglucosamine pyrophosphorylase/glucosamine-1-phosphate N-acetyltransferase
MLVAPVRIGKNATTGAGSVISRDVPDGALAIERSDQKNILEWDKVREKKAEKRLKKG